MQGIEEVERICHQNELDRAESHANADDEEPTGQESYYGCRHKYACARAYLQGVPETDRLEWRDTFTPWECLGCEICNEYEEER